MTNKGMEGPVQVLAPRYIPIPLRDVYRREGHPIASSSDLRGSVRGDGGVSGGPGRWCAPIPEIGLAHDSAASEDAIKTNHLTPVRVPSRSSTAGVQSQGSTPRAQRPNHHNVRRIFVQTETGALVAVQVDLASGGAGEKVKRSVQAALNVPTEQAELLLGGQVVEDLHEVQNDIPVLLRRRGITRSASSPCLARSLPASFPSMPAAVPASSSTGSPFGAARSAALAAQRTGNRGNFPAPGLLVQSHDEGGGIPPLFEVVGGVRPCALLEGLIEEAAQGVQSGVEPMNMSGGTGGAYCFRNAQGREVVIVKPTDEEPFAPNNPNGYVGRSLGQPGLKKAIRVGEAGVREVAAYLLDHGAFAGVPYTALVRASHPAFNVNSDHVTAAVQSKGRAGSSGGMSSSAAGGRGGVKGGLSQLSFSGKGQSMQCTSVAGVGGLPWPPAVGGGEAFASKLCSLQQYVQHDYDTSECGFSRFPVSAVHRIGILDIRVFNTDRHSGNILVRKRGREMFERHHVNPVLRVDEAVQLIPIDHGFCLPETLEAAYFEWLHWPQASLPFSEDELEYIASLDAHADVLMLRERLPMIREGCLRILVLSTTLLQRGAAAGLTLAEIGAIMSREVRGTEEVASELEMLCLKAMKIVKSPEASPSLTSSGANDGGPLPLASGARAAAPRLDAGLGEDCATPSSCSSGGSTPRQASGLPLHSPGLFFDLEEDGDAGSEGEEDQPLALRPSTIRGGFTESSPSPRWPSMLHQQKGGRPAVRASRRLEFGSGGLTASKGGMGSALTSNLRNASETPSAQICRGSPLAAAGPPLPASPTVTYMPSPAIPGRSRKLPCRHESLWLRRFRQTGPAQPHSILPQLPGGPAGLKLGSAGVMGRRLKAIAAAGHSTEEDVDGVLPGGASFLLSDMEEATWELFYDVYVDLVDDMVLRKASERGQGTEYFGTSCQW